MTTALIRPRSLDEVLASLADGDSTVVAGGLTLVPLLDTGRECSGRLVLLADVPECVGVAESSPGGAIRIGALTTHQEVADHPAIRRALPLASRVFGAIGNLRVRAWGTIGGNLAAHDRRHDPPTLLAMLGAGITVAAVSGTRTLLTEDLCAAKQSPVRADEIITSVLLPAPEAGTGMGYVKFTLNYSDYGFANAAAQIRVEDGVVSRRGDRRDDTPMPSAS